MSNPTRPAEPWLDELDEGLVLVDDGRVRWLNRAAARFLDIEAERALGLPLIAVLRDHRLERAYLDGGTVEIPRGGRTLQARPVSGGLALRDVSELRSSQEGARELLAVLSHELRTPVTTIRSTLEALGYDLPETQRDRFLSRARAECERLVRLVEDLTVDVAPPRARRVALLEVVARARGLVQPRLDAHRVELVEAVPDLIVWADVDKVLQVIVNLVENAAVHGPDDATVELAAEAVDEDGARWVALTVRDTGTPLEPDRIDELFEAHTRGPSAKTKGTGLGLYIVRSIAGRWHGRAWGRPLASGNEFGVTIPLDPQDG